MHKKLVSNATGQPITNDRGSVSFRCPGKGILMGPNGPCSGPLIVRTSHERAIVAKYKCPECGFAGPN